MTNRKFKVLSCFIVLICWLPQVKFLIPWPTREVAEKISLFAEESFAQYPEIVDIGGI